MFKDWPARTHTDSGRTNYDIKKSVTLTLALLLSAHILLFYALPFKILAFVFIGVAIFFVFIGGHNAIMVSVPLAIATLLLGGFLKISGINESIYYRPHEKFKLYRRYQENVRFEMTIPHGDLKALSFYEEVTPEPRNVIFRTDSLGFRNYRDYHGQEYLLVGDSFIVGNGTTQNDILTEQLFKQFGIDTYNLAYAGEIEDYVNYVQSFEELLGHTVKVVLFLFEGNDFPLNSTGASPASSSTKASKSYNPIVEKLQRYYRFFPRTDIYRFTYARRERIWARIKGKEQDPVEVRNVGDIRVAFYKEYIAVAERELLPENPQIETNIWSLRNSITHIFFIPTKYRVYYKHIAGSTHNKIREGLPNKQWELVQIMGKKFDIPVTDLTPALIEKSDDLLQEGILTFWKDDTHWNKHGIAVAADMVGQVLQFQDARE